MKNEEKYPSVRLEQYPSGEYKEVGSSDLQSLTSQGWRIISGHLADRVEVASRQVVHPNAGQQPNGCYNAEYIMVQEPFVVKEARYLLWLDEKSALGRLNEAFQKSQDEEQAAKDQAHTLAKGIKEAEGKVEDLESAIRGLRVSNEDLKKGYKSQGERMRKMEDDLGKVREAIGSKAFSEIVKEET